MPPAVNSQPDPGIPLDCLAEEKRELPQEFVLINSFSFGCCNSWAVFKRVR